MTAALVIMTTKTLINCGLPASSFTSISLFKVDAQGRTETDRHSNVARIMVKGHSDDIRIVPLKPDAPYATQQPQTKTET